MAHVMFENLRTVVDRSMLSKTVPSWPASWPGRTLQFGHGDA